MEALANVAIIYAKANNHYMTDYDPTKQETFLMYFNDCYLYGLAMSPLPMDDFRWLSEKEIARLDVHNIPDDRSKGYVFEYPQSLHDKHKDLPFVCKHFAPPVSTLKNRRPPCMTKNYVIFIIKIYGHKRL